MNAKAHHFCTDAEEFDFSEVDKYYVESPSHPLILTKSTLLVGNRGVGKTMFLKQLCNELRKDNDAVAVYIELAQLAGPIRDEILGIEDEFAPRSIELRAAAAVRLTTNILKLAEKHSAFPLNVEDYREFVPPSIWATDPSVMDRNARRLCGRLVDGRDVKFGPTEVGSVREMVSVLGDECRDHGAGLRLLIDQFETGGAPLADELPDLLRKGMPYRTILATRPHPLGPKTWKLPITGSDGENFRLHSLDFAASRRGQEDFLRRFLGQVTSNEALCEAILSQRVALARIFRGSLRSFVLLAQAMESQLSQHGTEPRKVLSESVAFVLAEERARLVGAMKGTTKDFHDIVSKWKSKSKTERRRQKVTATFGPTHLRIIGDRKQAEEAFITTLTRVGGLFPVKSWVPGVVSGDYELSPAFLLDSPVQIKQAIGTYSIQPTVITPSNEDYRRWSKKPHSITQPGMKSAFYSYSFGDDVAKAFGDKLKDALTGRMEFQRGALRGGEKIGPDIRSRISKAHALVAEVSGPRHEIYCEIGMAIGLSKTLFLAAHQTPEGAPEWLKGLHQFRYNTASDSIEFASQIRTKFDHGLSPLDNWNYDPQNKSMNPKVDPRLICVVAGQPHLAGILNHLETVCKPEGVEVRSLDPGVQNTKNLIYQLVRLTREAGTIVIAPSIDDLASNLTMCTAAGLFWAKSNCTVQKRRFDRSLEVLFVAKPKPTFKQFPDMAEPANNCHVDLAGLQGVIAQRIPYLKAWKPEGRRHA